MSQIGRVLIIFGILLIVSGLLLSLSSQIPFLNKLGRLPGDLIIKRGNFTFYFPLATCLLISFVLYIVSNVLRR